MPPPGDVDVVASALRIFIILGCLAAIVAIVAINHPDRKRLGGSYVMVRMGVVAVLLAVAYASIETQLQGIPLNPRLWLLAGGLTWLDIGCATTLIERRRKRRKH